MIITYYTDRRRLGKTQQAPKEGETSPYTLLALRLAPFYIWLSIITLQSHKEERFAFPIYPLLCFNAAVGVYFVKGWLENAYVKATKSPWRVSKHGYRILTSRPDNPPFFPTLPSLPFSSLASCPFCACSPCTSSTTPPLTWRITLNTTLSRLFFPTWGTRRFLFRRNTFHTTTRSLPRSGILLRSRIWKSHTLFVTVRNGTDTLEVSLFPRGLTCGGSRRNSTG